jgi:hypothetical protein
MAKVALSTFEREVLMATVAMARARRLVTTASFAMS